MEINIIAGAVAVFMIFSSGYLIGVCSEKHLWTRNCLNDIPHYSDGVPYHVIKLGIPQYVDDHYIGGMEIKQNEIPIEMSIDKVKEYRIRGWVFAYDEETKFIGAYHDCGGKQSVCEIKNPFDGNSFGYAMTDFLNDQ